MWRSSGTSRTRGMSSALRRTRSAWSRRFSRSLGESSSSRARRVSRSPYWLTSLAAVFSPTPGTPGRLSEGSPRRAARSAYGSGGTPVRCFDAGLVVEGVVAHPPLVVEHPHVGVLDQLVGVPVAGDDDHRLPTLPGLGGQGGEHVVGLEALGARPPGWPASRAGPGSWRTGEGGRRGCRPGPPCSRRRSRRGRWRPAGRRPRPPRRGGAPGRGRPAWRRTRGRRW